MAAWAPAVYFILGQVGWFACVLSAASGRSWIGIGVVIALIALHLWRVARPIEEFKLLFSVMIIGGLWENVVAYCGLLTYPGSTVSAGWAPGWLPALWALFAAQFNTTYRWLKTRLLAAFILGVIAGPLSFRAGAALAAVRFEKPWPAVVTLALGWGGLLPVVTLLSRFWNGVDRPIPSNRSARRHRIVPRLR